jgi:hypothetical protein
MIRDDCIWQAECKDHDTKYCCENYREKAQGHCFGDGSPIRSKVFISRTTEKIIDDYDLAEGEDIL